MILVECRGSGSGHRQAHRIGQKKQVTVFRLIMKGTVEESILHLQESKSELAERIVTEGSVSLAGLGREELLKLLERDEGDSFLYTKIRIACRGRSEIA